MQKKLLEMRQRVVAKVKGTFRFATLNMIFVIAFVNVFQMVFGAENSIVGVIFAILMSASMMRDLTATPFKHLCIQALVLVAMAVCASLVTVLNPFAALFVNFAMCFVILYAYTYEYASHLYFPYILSYLFLIFIAPIPLSHLPKRMLGMLTGAVCVILYQLVMGRNRARETTRDALTYMIGEARKCIDCMVEAQGMPDAPEEVRRNLCRLSRMVYDRRKKALCISDASFAVVNAGRGLEHLILLLYDLEGALTPARSQLLTQISDCLEQFRKFVRRETDDIAAFERAEFVPSAQDPAADDLFNALFYIRSHLLQMTRPEKQAHYHETVMSLSVRLKTALNVSHVRVFYALRVAVLLSVFTLVTQIFTMPHGKWLLFTIASVSLPYADDVGTKAKKRFLATAAGGLVSVILFSLFDSPGMRTAIMMLSGYVSFYLSDYTGTFACSTVGALGGAVFMNVFGWEAVTQIAVIRLVYVIAGIAIALLANCLIFPFRRERATKQLWDKYASTCELLTHICKKGEVDPQLYYSLVIQAHLLEDKLCQNTQENNLGDMRAVLKKCRMEVRAAHRENTLETSFIKPFA